MMKFTMSMQFLFFLSNAGQIPLVGGDFNACIGEVEEIDHVEFIGPCGMGERNERGNALIEFVLEKGLCIFNRHVDMSHVNDG